MNDRIDGRTIGRQQLLQLVRDACASTLALADAEAMSPFQWQERAKSAIKTCSALQRGLIHSHSQAADELHMLVSEIQIAIAAQDHHDIFAARLEKIKAAVRRLEQNDFTADSPASETQPNETQAIENQPREPD